MNEQEIHDLREREKELNCLYRIMQKLKEEELGTEDVLKKVVLEMPDGWRYPGICMVKLYYQGKQFTTPGFFETNWYHSADIIVDENVMGEIRVYYTENITGDVDTLFLPEEHNLLKNIAEQISLFIFNRRLRDTLDYLQDDTKTTNTGKIELLPRDSNYHWRWRYRMTEVIAEQTDFDRFNIKAIYLIGSTLQAEAGPASDLDLMIHTDGDEWQRELISAWIDGWSRSLAEVNYERTGYRLKEGLIDLHFVSTAGINDKNDSFASMVGSLENEAQLIKKAR